MTDPVSTMDRQNAFELGFLKFAKDANLDQAQYAAFYNQGMQRFQKIAAAVAEKPAEKPAEKSLSEAAKKAPNKNKTTKVAPIVPPATPVAAGKGCK